MIEQKFKSNMLTASSMFYLVKTSHFMFLSLLQTILYFKKINFVQVRILPEVEKWLSLHCMGKLCLKGPLMGIVLATGDKDPVPTHKRISNHGGDWISRSCIKSTLSPSPIERIVAMIESMELRSALEILSVTTATQIPGSNPVRFILGLNIWYLSGELQSGTGLVISII